MQKGKRIGYIRQGDMFWFSADGCNLGGHIEIKCRPWMVVSSNKSNRSSPNVTIVPCSRSANRGFITHVSIKVGNRKQVVICEQPITIEKSMLGDYYGSVNGKYVRRVISALKIHFGMGGWGNE